MSTLKFQLATLIVFVVVCGYIIWLTERSRKEINCNMLIAGWHPDIPKEVKKKCLKERNDYLTSTSIYSNTVDGI
jgi:hypothetical protein